MARTRPTTWMLVTGFNWRFALAIILAALFVSSGSILAQGARGASGHHVRGRVYDDIARRALAGAVVHAVSLDSTATYTTIADSTGRYEFAGLPDGAFALEFEHDALDVLGIRPPVRSIVIPDDDRVDLAIPNGAIVREQVCRTTDANALLVGRVTRAATGAPLEGGEVVAHWSELTVAGGKLRSVDRESRGAVDATGRYQLCDVPGGGPTAIGISIAGFYPIDLELTLPAGGTARQDFRLAAIGSSDRRSDIQLEVSADSGSPSISGRAEIEALGLRADIDSGRASIAGVPAGTWMMVVRAIGFEPKAIPVDAVGRSSHVAISLTAIPIVLDSVIVRARSAARDSAVLHDIRARLLTGNGTLIGAENLSVRNSIEASDAVAVATGFMWKGRTSISARPYATQHGLLRPCRTIEHADTLRVIGSKSVAIYLDGSRMPGGIEMVNQMVPPYDILAIEAYPDVISAPLVWRTNDACAVIAFWTKRNPGRPR